MYIIDKELWEYSERHTTTHSTALSELERETNLKTLMPQMISGQLQGTFLKMISMMCRPKKILEIGTFTGYSAICMAAGLAEGGMLHTIEVDEELKDIQMRYFEKAGVQDQIQIHIGNALEIIPDLEGPFDLIFMDADKRNYPSYLDLAVKKLSIGGYLLADNVLWSGKVVAPSAKDWDAQALDKFNKMTLLDTRLENVLLPIGDGIMMARKLSD